MQFFADMGVKTTLLHEFGGLPSRTKMEHEIGRAALIYTIGGNTPYLLSQLRLADGEAPLREALVSGKPHAGVSAGALLPFALIHSNVSARPAQEKWDFEVLHGLAVVDAIATAHANQHDPTPEGFRPDSRLEHLLRTFPESAQYGLAIDEGAAVTLGEQCAVIRADPAANVYLLTRRGDTIEARRVEDAEQLHGLSHPS